jgi:demethylmenaquinone methyltransferase/2-methoxy-6-polyprenyl-1,4-benzoquinol methylase
MSKELITPYKSSTESKREQVEKMFDNVSGNYDFLNKIITFGMDKGWRDNVLKLISKKEPKRILDIATGTGDMTLLFSKTNASQIVGVDISQGMLDVANRKISELNLSDRISTEVQDSENLTFADKSFDAASVSYGIRNFEHLTVGLAEIHRVLNDGGVFVVLETSVPQNPLIRLGYKFYTGKVMPRIARLFSKDKSAYQYLSDSAINFPYGEELKKILESVGFKNVKVMPQFFGVSSIYYAEK